MPASTTINGRQVQSGAIIPVYIVAADGPINVTTEGCTVTLTPGSEVDIIDRANRDLGRVDIADELPAGTQVIGQVQILGTHDGTNFVPPRIDSSTFVLEIIDYAHHEIHAGSAYHCHYTQLVSDVNDRSIITFRTPNTAKYLHIIESVSVSGPSLFQVLEAPTITNNTGVSLTVFNRNRNSASASGVWDTSQNPDVQGQATFFTEVTMGNVTGGTALTSEYLLSGAKNFASGGAARGTFEWMLLPNTLYAFELTSLTNDDNYHSIELDWYEHTDRV